MANSNHLPPHHRARALAAAGSWASPTATWPNADPVRQSLPLLCHEGPVARPSALSAPDHRQPGHPRSGSGALEPSSAWLSRRGASCLETACKLPGRPPSNH